MTTLSQRDDAAAAAAAAAATTTTKNWADPSQRDSRVLEYPGTA